MASQLRPKGWFDELFYDGSWDDDSHFILDGVLNGFHVLDKEITITPYHNANYASATCPANRTQLETLLVDEISSGKLLVCNETPVCVHSLGVMKKANVSKRPITDCKRPVGIKVNSFMKTTFSTFKYKTCDDAVSYMTPC